MARLAAGEGCNYISGDFFLTFGTKNIYNKNDIQINIFVTHFIICSNPGPIIGLPGFSLCALGSLLGSIVTLTMLLYSTCSTYTAHIDNACRPQTPSSVSLLSRTCSTRTGSTSTTGTSTRRWLATSSATSSLCVLATILLNRWGRRFCFVFTVRWTSHHFTLSI